MARVRLVHWNGPEGRERRLRLAGLGHQVEFDDLDGGPLLRSLRASPPDAYVIDLSRLPAHGREIAMALRSYKDTRSIPIVFVDGDPEKVARLKALLPDATYTTWGRLKPALARAVANPPARPVVPPSSIYTGRPTVDKLGVKPGMRVCLLGAPKGFPGLLEPRPTGTTLTARPAADCGLFLVVVRSRAELNARLVALGRVVDRQPVWIIWPKKASGIKADVDGNVVRNTGLAAGWVDYKVCSVDDTWSALAFKRRR